MIEVYLAAALGGATPILVLLAYDEIKWRVQERKRTRCAR